MGHLVSVILMIFFLFYSVSWGDGSVGKDTIEVQEAADARSSADINDIFQLQVATVGIETPCEEQMIADMKKSGKTDQEIADFIANADLQEKCKCIIENKAQLAKKLKDYDTILSNHPDWKGKYLTVKESNGVEYSTDTAILENFRRDLSECQ